MKSLNKILITLLMIGFNACNSPKESVDLVLLNGNIITLNNTDSKATAVAVKSDTIIAVGTDYQIKEFIGESTEIIDLKGKTVIPGFIESHAHLIGLGKSKINLDLTDTQNWDEVIAKVVAASENTKPGDWIIGRGWHQEKWNTVPHKTVNGYPYNTMLNKAVPYNPVMLSHASGHAILVNQKAIDLAEVTDSTKSPEGGNIVKDENGQIIGVFEETAEDLINNKYLQYMSLQNSEQLNRQTEREIISGVDESLKNGITSFHDAGETFAKIDLLKKLVDENKIKIRLYIMVGDTLKNLRKNLVNYKTIGYGNNFLTIRSIKIYIDGALGSRGAWLLEPYEDLQDHRGLNVTPLSEIREVAELALTNGYQLCTHAIGDRGNREILDIYEDVFSQNTSINNFRWRVEHAQHLSTKDILRFSKLGVIPAMQGVHCTSDAPFVIKRLGYKRAEEGAYVWRKLIDNGAIICNGTDAPVENVSPLQSFYSTVTRQLKSGEIFFQDQKMTRIEALKSYTINGAYAAFEENIKGSIEKGKLADFTVLSKDILTIPDKEILSTEVLMTIVGGKILFAK